MEKFRPETPEQLAEAFGSAASARKTITLGGAFSKDKMGGPVAPADITISTTSLNRVLEYEPRDLTISVEAGITYDELSRVLEKNRQMVPLDPPFSGSATIGGILATNTCGPRRRLYGTARDVVIGMKFATLEGELVESGGMVVKNAAGLDMSKILIGSFGTLAAIVVANFKLAPMTPFSRTFVLGFDSANEAFGARDTVLRGVLQPAAIDVLNPRASTRLGREGWLLVLQAGGNAAVMGRYARELTNAQPLGGEEEKVLWEKIRNFVPDFLADHPDAAVVRVSSILSELREVMDSIQAPVVARAGSGVAYGCCPDCEAAATLVSVASRKGWKSVVEFAPESRKQTLDLWPSPGDDFVIMKRVKQMFDPENLLNRGRLYGRL